MIYYNIYIYTCHYTILWLNPPWFYIIAANVQRPGAGVAVAAQLKPPAMAVMWRGVGGRRRRCFDDVEIWGVPEMGVHDD